MHVVTEAPEPFLAMGGRLEVHVIPLAHDNLGFVARCTETGHAAAIDGPSALPVLRYLEARDIRLTAVWNTHTHADHIGINQELARLGLLGSLSVVGPAKVAAQIPGLTNAVGEGDVIALGALSARVLQTEGHLDGHVSFVVGDVLFCGDTLFAGGCGRVFGTHAQLFDSLQRLARLDGATWVCCAHEYSLDNLKFARSVLPDNAALHRRWRDVAAARASGRCVVPSQLDEERATNPFLRADDPALVDHLREAVPEADLSTPLAVFTATRRLKDTGAYRSLPDEPGG